MKKSKCIVRKRRLRKIKDGTLSCSFKGRAVRISNGKCKEHCHLK